MANLIAQQDVEVGVELNIEGQRGARFFLIVEGEAEVMQGGTVLGRLRPGDHFGEIAILSDGPRTATVVATTPMKVLVMFGPAFRLMEEEFPAVAKAIYTDAAQRLNDDDDR